MDSILSAKNRTKKRKDNPEDKVIRVTAALYIDGYKLQITFNDGTVKTVDFGPFLQANPHPVHNKYRNIQFFKRFKIEGGSLVWGKNWDLIFPVIQLYKGHIKV